jgi:hypothetical protein
MNTGHADCVSQWEKYAKQTNMDGSLRCCSLTLKREKHLIMRKEKELKKQAEGERRKRNHEERR